MIQAATAGRHDWLNDAFHSLLLRCAVCALFEALFCPRFVRQQWHVYRDSTEGNRQLQAQSRLVLEWMNKKKCFYDVYDGWMRMDVKGKSIMGMVLWSCERKLFFYFPYFSRAGVWIWLCLCGTAQLNNACTWYTLVEVEMKWSAVIDFLWGFWCGFGDEFVECWDLKVLLILGFKIRTFLRLNFLSFLVV